MKLRVGLIEDDARLRESLTDILKTDPECVCVGAFPDGELAVAELPALLPQVVICDVNLPGINGIECVRQLSPLLPDTQFMMLTAYQDTELIFEALAAGAHGYLLKPVRVAQLRAAIRDVVAGGAPMTGIIARQIVHSFHRSPQAEAPSGDLLGVQEKRVLELLSEGFLYKQVAQELSVSMNTVCEYIRRAYKKLQVHSRHEAVTKYRDLVKKQ